MQGRKFLKIKNDIILDSDSQDFFFLGKTTVSGLIFSLIIAIASSWDRGHLQSISNGYVAMGSKALLRHPGNECCYLLVITDSQL